MSNKVYYTFKINEGDHSFSIGETAKKPLNHGLALVSLQQIEQILKRVAAHELHYGSNNSSHEAAIELLHQCALQIKDDFIAKADKVYWKWFCSIDSKKRSIHAAYQRVFEIIPSCTKKKEEPISNGPSVDDLLPSFEGALDADPHFFKPEKTMEQSRSALEEQQNSKNSPAPTQSNLFKEEDELDFGNSAPSQPSFNTKPATSQNSHTASIDEEDSDDSDDEEESAPSSNTGHRPELNSFFDDNEEASIPSAKESSSPQKSSFLDDEEEFGGFGVTPKPRSTYAASTYLSALALREQRYKDVPMDGNCALHAILNQAMQLNKLPKGFPTTVAALRQAVGRFAYENVVRDAASSSIIPDQVVASLKEVRKSEIAGGWGIFVDVSIKLANGKTKTITADSIRRLVSQNAFTSSQRQEVLQYFAHYIQHDGKWGDEAFFYYLHRLYPSLQIAIVREDIDLGVPTIRSTFPGGLPRLDVANCLYIFFEAGHYQSVRRNYIPHLENHFSSSPSLGQQSSRNTLVPKKPQVNLFNEKDDLGGFDSPRASHSAGSSTAIGNTAVIDDDDDSDDSDDDEEMNTPAFKAGMDPKIASFFEDGDDELDFSNPLDKPHLQNTKPSTPPAQLNLTPFRERLEKAVQNANSGLKKIQNENFTSDISNFIALIRTNCLEMIKNISEESLVEQIVRNAEMELECAANNIQELLLLQESPQNEAVIQNAESISEPAKEWAKQIRAFLVPGFMPFFERQLQDGSKKGYLNHKYPVFISAALFHHLAKVETYNDYLSKLMQYPVDPALKEDVFGNTPLMWALANACNGNAMAILRTMGTGPYLNVQCKSHKNTALHLCVGKGYKNKSADGKNLQFSNLQILETLLALKANPNMKNKEGNTPLHLACARRDTAMIQALLQAGANPRILNNEGKRPQDLLYLSHQAASQLLFDTVAVFSLDRGEFEANLKPAERLFA